MATTRGWSLKGNIVNAVEYILDVKNGFKKTCDGILVATSSDSISPLSSAYEWKIENISKGYRSDSVGYHFQFSLPPNVGTEYDCMMMAKEWINMISDGKAKYVIAVHNNTNSLHAHIICDNHFNDGKFWDIYWKKDSKRFRACADKVCKSHGYDVLEETAEKGMEYFEWMNKKDTVREELRKIMDVVISQVTSYEEFKQFMSAIGYKVMDNSDEKNLNKNIFTFTVNRKLIQRDDDGFYVIRIPYHKNDYIRIDEENFTWIKEGVNAKIQIPIDKEIALLGQGEIFQGTILAKDLKKKFEDKCDPRGRKGLRIKAPNSNKVIRTKSIYNDDGESYTMEYIKDKIKNNDILLTSNEVLHAIQNKDNYQVVNKIKKEICEKAGVHVDISSSGIYKSLKQANYFNWMSEKTQRKMDELSYHRLLEKDRKNLPTLKERMDELQTELKNINITIENVNQEIENLVYQRMEDVVRCSDEELEQFILETKEPLLERKRELKEMIELYKQRIDKAEDNPNKKVEKIIERVL